MPERENTICAIDETCCLMQLLTYSLPVVVYTLKYIISMDDIQIIYISNNFSDVTGCDIADFQNYKEFCKNVVSESINFFDFLKDQKLKHKFCTRKYKVHASSGGNSILLDYSFSKKISEDEVLLSGIIINNTETEVYNLALSISEERLRLALEASGAGFFDWEQGSKTIFCDKMTSALFNLKSVDIGLKELLYSISRDTTYVCISTIRDIFSGRAISFKVDVKVENIKTRWLCISGKVIASDPETDHPTRIAGMVSDITLFKNILFEREKMNDILEKRVQERTQQLETELATKISAEKQLIKNFERERELNNTKSVFINMVSHEFRTPLAIIQASTDLMQTYYEKLSTEDRNNSLTSIKRAVQRMTRLMDDILILGKVQSNQIQFSPKMTDIMNLCHCILDEMECMFSIKRIVFEINENVPHEVFVDEGLLEHIISNLLSNALKYSSEDKNVILRIEYENKELLFYVKDKGIGIPQEDIDSIFKLFYRGSNVSNKQGIGVGMFVVKYCVSLHNGTISFSSKKGCGTIFKVAIPVSNEANL